MELYKGVAHLIIEGWVGHIETSQNCICMQKYKLSFRSYFSLYICTLILNIQHPLSCACSLSQIPNRWSVFKMQAVEMFILRLHMFVWMQHGCVVELLWSSSGQSTLRALPLPLLSTAVCPYMPFVWPTQKLGHEVHWCSRHIQDGCLCRLSPSIQVSSTSFMPKNTPSKYVDYLKSCSCREEHLDCTYRGSLLNTITSI